MSRCYCRAVMAALVIVFAWLTGFWVSIALTVLGVLLVAAALSGTCCCTSMREQKGQSQVNAAN